MKDLTVQQCYFKQTDRGLRIKTRRGRGESAIIDGITFEDIYMDDVLTPLVMNMYYYCDDDGKTEYVYSKEMKYPVDHRTPYLGSFTFKNIVCHNVHVAAGFFYGLPEQPIKRIELNHITFNYAKHPQEGIPAMMSYLDPMKGEGLHFRYVNEVILNDVTINNPVGERIVTQNVLKIIETSEQN